MIVPCFAQSQPGANRRTDKENNVESKRLNRNLLPLMAVASLAAATPAHADDATDGWHYEATVYAWAKSIKGTSGDVDIDLDFLDDIADLLQGAFMLSLEAEKGDWSLFGALEYSDIGDSARIERSFDFTVPPDGPTVPIGIGTRGEFSEEEYLADLGVGWAFSDNDTTRWNLLGGVKWFKYETEFKFSRGTITGPGGGEIPLDNRKIKADEDWWHPFVGISVRSQLGDAWRLRARADYGYEESDNTSWMIEAMADWRFNNWGALEFGYRYLDIDYDSGGSNPYLYDVEQKGPVVGLIIHF
jgi:hypothetical protein